ncbi:Glycoside hydrolase family 43 (Modular protein) [Frankia sp. Hr75.2]|nr:Glycoside hydrolase family 43 (Modular protein) [Frankia sp. Hr75.2]
MPTSAEPRPGTAPHPPPPALPPTDPPTRRRGRPPRRVAVAAVAAGALIAVGAVVAVLVTAPIAARGGSAQAPSAASVPSTGTSGASGTPGGSGGAPSDGSSPGSPADERGVVAVRGSNLADPYVLAAGATSYAYGTNADDANIPVLVSTDPELRTWTRAGDALPRLPGWAQDTGFTTWAPAVARVDDGYVLYYATRVAATGHQCVSTAHAASPTGPFADTSAAPLICQESEGGSIDPSPYTVGADRYLTWKSEGILPGTTPAIWAQRLSPDGGTLLDAPVRLLTPTLGWQHGVVEGPAMLARGDHYELLYSAGDWHSPEYATGSADCAGPLGPCTPRPDPLLRTGTAGVGPGGAEPFRAADGTWWLAFHTWNRREPADWPHADRQLVLSPLAPSGALALPGRPGFQLGRVVLAR